MSTLTPAQLKELTPQYLAQDDGQPLFHVSVAFIILQTFFFALYVASRFTVRASSHGVEAWLFIPAAYLFCMGHCINGILLVKIGGAGRHLAYWLLKDPLTITTYLKIQTAEEAIYMASVTRPKLAIITLYLKVFVDRWARRLTWVVGVMILLNGISGLIVVFTLCRPFRYKWDKTIPGHCANLMASYRYVSIPNIVTDIGILLLPISTLYKLQVSKARNVGIFITFLTGGFGIVTALIRFVNFFTNDLMADPTYLCISTMSWTIIEPAAYMICSILPNLRSLLRYVAQDSKWGTKFSSLRSHLVLRSSARGASTMHDDVALSNPASSGNKSKVSAKIGSADSERTGFVKLRESEVQQSPTGIATAPHEMYYGQGLLPTREDYKSGRRGHGDA